MFSGGPKEAAKMLAALSSTEAKRILAEISKSDPKMAALLESQMIQVEDLVELTPSMIVDFTRKCDLKVLGLALRICTPEIQDKVLSQLSRGLREDVEVTLKGPPVPVSKAEEAQTSIKKLMREMLERGEIVLGGSDKLV